MKTGLAILALALATAGHPVQAAKPSDCGLGKVLYNTDGCDMLCYPRGDAITYEQFVSYRLGRDVPGSSVTAVGYCPVSSGFGLFTALKMGDTLTDPAGTSSSWRGRRVYNATRDFAAKGLDALEMGLRYARSQGRAGVVSFRMNDTHDWREKPGRPYILFSPFKRTHPECLFGSYSNQTPYCCWTAVDFACEPVREAFVGYVRELVANYDFDAVDLDFFRHVQLFRSVALGAESATEEERALLTDMMRKVRTVLNEAGRRKGRDLALIARTPDSPAYCRAVGIDIERWLREDLVDVWVGAGYFRLRPWKKSAALAHRHGKAFYASIDESRVEEACAKIGRQFLPGRNSVANFAARVAAATEEGCDGIEFFNIDDYPDEVRRDVSRLTPGKTDGLDKDYFAVSRGSGGYKPDFFLKNGYGYSELPAVDPGLKTTEVLRPNVPCAFTMVLSDDFSGKSARAKITAEVLLAGVGAADVVPTLTVNGHVVVSGRPFASGNPKYGLTRYDLPVKFVRRGENVVSVTSPVQAEFRDFVVRVRAK